MKAVLSVRTVALPIVAFFVAKILSGLLLLKLSAEVFSVADFGIFAQFLFFGALVSLIAAGGAQNGVVREVAASAGARTPRVGTAAFALWGIAFLTVALVAVALADPISRLLTHDSAFAWAVPAVAIAAVASGPTQIWCAVLTGLGRSRDSLAAQGVGLLVGTTAAAYVMVAAAAPAAAAVAFYLGSLTATLVSGLAVRKLPVIERASAAVIVAEIRLLLGYSGGLVIVAATTMLTMFALRYAYLGSFDDRLLSFWLVAQRISDLSTQLLGLFMIQYVVPAVSAADRGRRSTLIRNCWLVATILMGLVLAVFAVAPDLWVRLLLAAEFAPAIPMIVGYMIGDVVRATVSLAMHVALARTQVRIYAGLEIAAMVVMIAVTLSLVAFANQLAPVIGYVSGYAVVAAGCVLWWLFRRGRVLASG